jgi:hypothetical protein
MQATIEKNLVEVIHSRREINQGIQTEFLTLDVPNGWDDVKKISKKVLKYGNKTFTFRGWNSDSNQCFFVENNSVAKIV